MKKTVELAPMAAMSVSTIKDGLEMIVRVPLSCFEESWEQLGCHIDYLARELSEEDLRLRCAAFYAVYGSLPLLSSDLTHWSLRTGCRNSVWEVVKSHFGIEELKRRLSSSADA